MNTGGETIGGGTAATDSDDDTAAAGVTSAARKVTVSGREILDDVTWLIGRATASASSVRMVPASPRCLS